MKLRTSINIIEKFFKFVRNKFLLKIKIIYERFLLFLYSLIKNRLFQKSFLILILAFSITFSIISLVFGLKIYPYTWFFLPLVIGFFTIPCFLIPISIFFLKNLDLFDSYCENVFNLFVKPWLILILIILFSLGFLFIYWTFSLPKLTYILTVLPILPIYIITTILGFYKSPTGHSSSIWAKFYIFVIIIPLIICCFHLIGKKILSNIGFLNDENSLIPKTFNIRKYNTKKLNLKKEVITIWCVSASFYFLIFIHSNFAYDTPIYYLFAKDFFESGNLDLIFNPDSRSDPRTDLTLRHYYSVIPPVLLLIFFTIICGGDLELGMVVMITVLFSVGPPLIILITKNIINDSQIAKWAGILYLLSGPTLFYLASTLKHLLSIDLILISLFILSCKYKKKSTKRIATLIAFSLIIIQVIFYIFLFGIAYLILTQYFLRKKKINFSILKNPKIYRLIKLLIIYASIGLILVFFLFGFFLDIIGVVFNTFLTYLDTMPVNINTQRSISDMLYPGLTIASLGIWFIFLIIGINIDNKEKVIENNMIKFLLVTLLECTAIFVFLYPFGFDFFTHRMICFFPIVVSIFGAIGIVKLKKIFPKILMKKPNFQKIVELSLLITLIFSNILATSYMRNAYTHQEELDAIEWFKTRSDYEKLTNKNTTDIQIISNGHLINWIKYRIHYNAYVRNFYFDDLEDLSSLKLNEKELEVLKDKADDKLYILISKNKEPFGENWTIKGLIDFFEEFQNYYNFTWNKYKINNLVEIWEIEYIN